MQGEQVADRLGRTERRHRRGRDHRSERGRGEAVPVLDGMHALVEEEAAVGGRAWDAPLSFNRIGPDPVGSDPIEKCGWPRSSSVRRSPAPGALKLAPLPAWSAPRVGQDQRGRLSWTLLHLGLALWPAHLGFDLPDVSIGADVDIPAREPDVTIPPVMLNSHLTNLRANIDTSARGRLVKIFRRQVRTGCPIRWILARYLAKRRHIRAACLQ